MIGLLIVLNAFPATDDPQCFPILSIELCLNLGEPLLKPPCWLRTGKASPGWSHFAIAIEEPTNEMIGLFSHYAVAIVSSHS